MRIRVGVVRQFAVMTRPDREAGPKMTQPFTTTRLADPVSVPYYTPRPKLQILPWYERLRPVAAKPLALDNFQQGRVKRDLRHLAENHSPRLKQKFYPADSFLGMTFPVRRGEVHVFHEQDRETHHRDKAGLRRHRQNLI